MIFQGRVVNIVALWESLGVDFPSGLGATLPTFLPLVKCPNPSHDTNKRHFQVNARQPMVHCFAGCGISGSYEHAVAIVLGLYYEHGVTVKMLELARVPRVPREDAERVTARAKVEAVYKAARKVILGFTRVALSDDLSEAVSGTGTRKSFGYESAVAKDLAKLDSGEFTFLPTPARDYLDSRGIEAASRGKWQLGWCEDEERIIIPSYDERGIFRFLIKRSIGSKRPKYLYTEGGIKTSLLYGACVADREAVRSQGLVLCEGSLDVIRLHQHGIKNAVAILGTGLSLQQVRIIDRLAPKRIYTFFDKDSSGGTNTLDVRDKVTKVPIRVCLYPRSKADPAEMTTEEVRRSIAESIPMMQFIERTRNVQVTRRANGNKDERVEASTSS